MEELRRKLRCGQQWRTYAIKGTTYVALCGDMLWRYAVGAEFMEPAQLHISEGCAHVVEVSGWIVVEALDDAEFGWTAPDEKRPLQHFAAMFASFRHLSRAVSPESLLK